MFLFCFILFLIYKMVLYTEGTFKKNYPFEKRELEFLRIHDKYPNRIPIIVEQTNEIPDIMKHKFLVPEDITIGQFSYILRKRIKLSSDKAMYILFDKKYMNTSKCLREIYEKFKDKDGFLYCVVSGENTFG